MQSAHMSRNRNHTSFALVTATVTVEKEIPLAVNGDIISTSFEKDYPPGIYGFTSQEKRDKFKSMLNNANDELKACVAVSLQPL